MSSVPVPILLPPNPVWRSYRGGSVLRQFRSLPPAPDNHFPEDWLASTVRARNGRNSSGPDEGLSKVAVNGRVLHLSEFLNQAPHRWLAWPNGSRHTPGNLGVLWKLLDSSVRLQLQAHPDADFARAHLKSNAGKTECWYILSTRGEGHVYLGFQHPPTRAEWARLIGEQDVQQMLECFEKIPVQPGDCYVVPAGTPHAIGAGVFMVELMEPTDWVVRCETVNAGLRLPPEACFMGLSLEECLDVFDYRSYSVEQVRNSFRQGPQALAESKSCLHEEIIRPPWHNFFRLERLRGQGNALWAGGELMLVIVLRGTGELTSDNSSIQCTAGQTLLLPGAISQWHWQSDKPWELLLLKLPIS